MHFWYGVARVLPNSHKYIDGVSRVGSDDYLYSGISFSIWVIGYFLVRLIVGGRIKKGGGGIWRSLYGLVSVFAMFSLLRYLVYNCCEVRENPGPRANQNRRYASEVQEEVYSGI